MVSYWYSTDGMDQKRLSSRHLDLLDEAYERRMRVEIFGDTTFGSSVRVFANPFLGTMTAGDIHYGLYRHPPLARNSESGKFDSLVLFDSTAIELEEPAATCVSSGSSSSAPQGIRNQRYRFMHHHHTDGDSDSLMMDITDHRRPGRLPPLGPLSDMTTVNVAAATATQATALTMRCGFSGAGRVSADDDCICCVIS